MGQKRHYGWMKWLLAALVVATWGCAPSGETTSVRADESGATAASSANQGASMPAATPDPVPDPEAGSTMAPGDHQDAIGTITAIDASSLVVDGVVYKLTPSTEIKGSLAVGERVKLEYVVNADGSRTVIEAKSSEFFDDSGGSDEY